MTHAQKKVEWCLNKAKKELVEKGMHRGLVLTKSDINKAREHILKAEHYLKATDYLKTGGFSDISASTVFYAMYQCLLAIAIKFGYESRNQECTFALMYALIEEGKIALKKEILEKIASLDRDEHGARTSITVREQSQYGTKLSIGDDLYAELFGRAKELLSETKLVIEQ